MWIWRLKWPYDYIWEKWGVHGGSDDYEFACNEGDLGLIPESGRSPREGHGNPLRYFCLENPHGQKSLTGYSPRGHKEPDTTERLSTVCFLLMWNPKYGARYTGKLNMWDINLIFETRKQDSVYLFFSRSHGQHWYNQNLNPECFLFESLFFFFPTST